MSNHSKTDCLLQSMTAYASRSVEIENLGVLNCEIKTLNSKFLDIYCKLPDYLNFLEPAIRKLLVSSLGRGKLELSLSLKLDSSYKLEHVYNSKISEYLDLYQSALKLTENSGLAVQSLSVADLISEVNRQTVKSSSKESLNNFTRIDNDLINNQEDFNNYIISCVTDTVQDLQAERRREGAELKRELLNILNNLIIEVNKLEEVLPVAQESLIESYKAKFKKYVDNVLDEVFVSSNKELVNGLDIDNKLATEIAVYLNKIDINEELARLKLHTEEVMSLINKGGLVGRKLDFLMQELMRESNTLSAKSACVDFRNIAINLKVYIEQMREQIQNIE